MQGNAQPNQTDVYQIDTKLLPDARIAVVPYDYQNFQKLCHTVNCVCILDKNPSIMVLV